MELGTRILVVDDEVSVLTSIAKVFAFHGCVVEVAGGLEEAKARMEGGRFDVVLTDLKMAGPEDGLQVIESARRMHPNAVVLLMSANASLTGHSAKLNLRSDEIISKPMDVGTLLRKIDERLAASNTARIPNTATWSTNV